MTYDSQGAVPEYLTSLVTSRASHMLDLVSSIGFDLYDLSVGISLSLACAHTHFLIVEHLNDCFFAPFPCR